MCTVCPMNDDGWDVRRPTRAARVASETVVASETNARGE